MKNFGSLAALALMFGGLGAAGAAPPFAETYRASSEIIRGTDGTTYSRSEYVGVGTHIMRDNRRGRGAPDLWSNQQAHQFVARFTKNLAIPVLVSAEFGDRPTAERVARPYLLMFGQVPTILKVGVDAIMIQPGDAFWSGGQRRTIVFHHARFDHYYRSGHAEELVFHEATHASLEPGRWQSAEWKAAQDRDRAFISRYAQDFPDREDFAESFLIYYAARIRSDRLSQRVRDTINNTIPNRLIYFERLVPPQSAGFYKIGQPR